MFPTTFKIQFLTIVFSTICLLSCEKNTNPEHNNIINNNYLNNNSNNNTNNENISWNEEHIITNEPQMAQIVSWECPEGWVKVVHDEIMDVNAEPFNWCEPLPAPRLKIGDYVTPLKNDDSENMEICDPQVDGVFPSLGKENCIELGTQCGELDWPLVPEHLTGNRIYVSSSNAFSDADGSQSSPYNSISNAIEQADSGDIIVLDSGTFEEEIEISKDITLFGKCVGETIIKGPGPNKGKDAGVIYITENVKVNLYNLRISGEQNGIHVSAENADALMDGVWIHEAINYGVVVTKGKLTVNIKKTPNRT